MSSAVPGYEFELWWGLLAPAGTPPEIVSRLNAEVNKVLATPEIRRQFLQGRRDRRSPLTPAEFARGDRRDIPRWQKLARQQNITAE